MSHSQIFLFLCCYHHFLACYATKFIVKVKKKSEHIQCIRVVTMTKTVAVKMLRKPICFAAAL